MSEMRAVLCAWEETHCGEVVALINVCGSRCDLFLREIRDCLAKLFEREYDQLV